MTRTQWLMAFLLVVSTNLVGGARTAEASLVLSFDQPSSYSTTIGGTVLVNVYVSQVAGGPQVGVGNELLSGDIALTFDTKGAATALDSDVTFGPAWFTGLATTSTSGTSTILNVSLLSLGDISDLSTPLLLATFRFTGVSAGSTTISVAELDPTTADFITLNRDIVDPTNTSTALISVAPSAVPEPSSLILLATGAVVISPALRRIKKKKGDGGN